MVNTRLEAVLLGIGDGAKLEQLVSDLLQREEYDVDPTGTRGPDNKRDALLYRDSEQGILHCSIGQDLEDKLHDDAQKAADRDEDYDFFIFATTQNPATVKRDRLEKDIHDEYGWQTTILDLQRLRNKLRGDPDNHDLIRNHLNIDPNYAFHDPAVDAEEFHEERIEELQNRSAYYGSITDTDARKQIPDPPILAVHIIPAETFGNDHDRIGTNLPEPPGLTRGGYPNWYGDCVLTGNNDALKGEQPFTHYSCFHEDGWAEAITTYLIRDPDEQELRITIDKKVNTFLEDALDWYREVGISPPFTIYVTLLDAAEYTMGVPKRMWTPDMHRKFRSDVFTFGEVRIDSYDADVPQVMRKPLFRLWNRAGFPKSIHYDEIEEDGDTRYEWNPYR
ncbi:hypothetical protein [Natrinema versiforme]|uniref:Restriction endonuclease n=1 Tax=Natrinema versiforme TaxID=88724 RepID=A0A4P8WQE9_9EURY|nr:hypothetical protein [Natrinema versiforme]QCS44743.1 hypothetical protein FEJ81_20935 [Natrinema versiforme]